MYARETSLFWHFDYARLDYLHFVSRHVDTAAAEGERASRTHHCAVNSNGRTRRNPSRICPPEYRQHSNGCARAVGSIPWHRILSRSGWYQPHAAVIDRYRG